MKKLTKKMISALENGEKVVLCTILASSGSSPRGAGTRMAVFENGAAAGTVGGGQVEYLATQEAMEVLKTGKTHVRAFCLAPDQVASIGMICGGNVTIYYQLLTQKELPVIREMAAALERDANAWLYMEIKEDAVVDLRIVEEAAAKASPDLFCNKAILRQGESTVYTEPIARAGSVYVFGGGHVGRALVPVLANIGFRVIVFDNRKEQADQAHFPEAARVIFGDYSDIYSKITLTKNDYVVILTPGHQGDYMVLEQSLRSEPKYVGCIGSRRKIAGTQARLREAGIPENAIQSVHAPIGLPILAETPEEIAISIAAELIQCRAENK